MPGTQIFISYRRDDSRGWPQLIGMPLARVFGAGHVFIDTRCLAPGAEYPLELQQALDGCAVLLALIGPDWTRLQPDGHRRLDQPDDWVRRELRTALQRGVRTVPVLLGKARLPLPDELPEDLQPLLSRQGCEIRDERWDADLDALIESLASSVPRDEVGEVAMDLRRLLRLIHLNPETALAVGRSADELRAICRLTARLAARKKVHDLLHEIEEDCLQPLAAAPEARHLQPYVDKLAELAAGIATALQASAVPHGLALRLGSGLDKARDSLARLAAAAQAPAGGADDKALQAARRLAARCVQADLTEVLSALSPMDLLIADAAGQLRLDDLAQVLGQAHATLGDPAYADDRAHIAGNIAKLGSLAEELCWRVAEHGELQAFDDQLRTACHKGAMRGSAGAAVPAEWRQVCALIGDLDQGAAPPMPLLRARLQPGSGTCRHLRSVVEQLREQARQVEAKAPTAAQWQRLLRAQHAHAARAFNAADVELMALCARLGDLGDSLAQVLDSLGA